MPIRHAGLTGLTFVLAAGVLAPTFAASPATWDRLAQCESGQRWDIDTGNGYYGGLQFSAATWRAYGGTEFAEKAHLAPRAQQIVVAERLLADRGWTPWPSCAAKLGLTAADAAPAPAPLPPGEQDALAEARADAAAMVARKTDKVERKAAKAEEAQHKADKAERKVAEASSSKRPKAVAKAEKRAKQAAEAHEKTATAERKLEQARQELAALDAPVAG